MTYYRVKYIYDSVAPDGVTPVTLSSTIVFPKEVYEHTSKVRVGDKEYDASGLLLNNHFTMTLNTRAPTMTPRMDIEAPLVLIGPKMIVVSPDGYGFGSTEDKPQAYLQADVTARHAIDAVAAARQLLEEMGYSYGDLFAIIGYSQGGHSAMAVQRYFDTYGVAPEVISHIDFTLCGDGPYDTSAIFDAALQPEARTLYPCAIPLIAQGQIEGTGMNLSYSDYFRKPLDVKAIEWLNAKAYSPRTINDSIFKTVGGNSWRGVLVDDVLCTENFKDTTGMMAPFFRALSVNSLVKDWQPNSYTRFYLYHSRVDEIVPFFCMEHMRDFLKSRGVTGNRLDTHEVIGTHNSAILFFLLSSAAKLKSLERDYLDGLYIPPYHALF
ncbi:MAG: hypothetical protein K6A32_05350 [Bacteroidales bacterium]|nr:hypothetical protein [Bacteroidales bacterium]